MFLITGTIFLTAVKKFIMPNWLRALIAGYGAKKLGGGCLSTILIFIVIYFVLGQCNHPVVHHPVFSKNPILKSQFRTTENNTIYNYQRFMSTNPKLLIVD